MQGALMTAHINCSFIFLAKWLYKLFVLYLCYIVKFVVVNCYCSCFNFNCMIRIVKKKMNNKENFNLKKQKTKTNPHLAIHGLLFLCRCGRLYRGSGNLSWCSASNRGAVDGFWGSGNRLQGDLFTVDVNCFVRRSSRACYGTVHWDRPVKEIQKKIKWVFTKLVQKFKKVKVCIAYFATVGMEWLAYNTYIFNSFWSPSITNLSQGNIALHNPS